MQIKLLKILVEKMVDENAVPIVEILHGKKDVNEFYIARKMDMTINQIRNILYKLSAEGLVSFIRKKDKRKGWYIYYWTLDSKKSLIKIKLALERDIADLKSSLDDRQVRRFYICKPCNIEVTEEKALEDDFMCEECAEVYTLSDNTKDIRELKSKITRREKELEEISEEVTLILEKEEKKKRRVAKIEEKEAEKRKEEKKKERKALRDKTRAKKEPLKKTIKKTQKKKPAKKKQTKKEPLKKTIKKTQKKKPAKKNITKKKITKKKSKKR